jgi:segregation and condensation protein B
MALTPPALLEALLFASSGPVSKKRLAAMLEVTPALLQQAADVLRASLTNRGLSLVETDTEFELRTNPEASSFVEKLREGELSRDLGKAGLETLAVVLYRGGATRGEIDWVRGVNSSQTLRSLLMRGLIERGENPEDARRPRYIATVDALAHLGVGRKEELPEYEELTKALAREEARQAAPTVENTEA